MTVMRRGANTVINATQVKVALRWVNDPKTPDVDFMAVLLNRSGKVNTDDDLVFYNQPSHPNGKVQLGERAAGRYPTQAISVDLAGMPDSIDRVVLVCATDGDYFDQVEQLHLVVLDSRGGAELVRFNLTGDGVTALIAGELYRREGAWKFRAIDQGHVRGLERLATEYGIHVDTDTDTGAHSPSSAGPVAGRLAIPAGESIEFSLSGVPTGNSAPPDLALSALAYSSRHELIDLVWFLHPVEFDNGIRLHQPSASDSTSPFRMTVDLPALPEEVASIVLTASSFRRQRLGGYSDLSLKLTGRRGDADSLSVSTPGRNEPSVLMAVLTRTGRGWTLVPVREYRAERCALDLVAAGGLAVRSLAESD
ncbi:MAG: TerD family protein [Jatrophihabitantaceae bacterium]